MSSAVEHVDLPGVGVRSSFTTRSGLQVGVLAHHSGPKDLLVYSAEDPDRCSDVMTLDPAEAQAMADLLGVAPLGGVTDRMHIGSLAVAWTEVGSGWWIEGRDAGAAPMAATGIGIIRDEHAMPVADAGPLQRGDVLLLVGLPDDVDRSSLIMKSGP